MKKLLLSKKLALLMLLLIMPTMIFYSCKEKPIISLDGSGFKTEFHTDEEFSIGNNAKITATLSNKKTKNISLSRLQSSGEGIWKNEEITIDFTSYNSKAKGEYFIRVTSNKSNVLYQYKVTVTENELKDTDYEVTDYLGTYDGLPHSITVNVKVEGATVTYSESEDLTAERYVSEQNIVMTNVTEKTIYFIISKEGYKPIHDSGLITIEKKQATITANNKTIEYKQGAQGFNFTAEGVIADDYEAIRKSITYSTPGYSINNDVTDEKYTIIPRLMSQADAKANNYDFNFVSGELTVIKADNSTLSLGCSIDNTYGKQVSLLLNSKNTEATPIYYYKSTDSENWIEGLPIEVGEYNIKVNVPATNNYNEAEVISNDIVRISKANLHLYVEDITQTYGDTFDYNQFNILAEKDYGFAYNDNIYSLTGSLTRSLLDIDDREVTEITNLNAGEYKMTIAGLDSNSYNITFINGKLTINKAENTLTATASNKIYDGDEVVLEVSQTANENENSVLTYKYQLKDTTTYVDGLPKDAGEYNIKVMCSSTKNYLSNQTDIENVVISKKDLTIRANDVELSYGDTFTNNGAKTLGFVKGEGIENLEGSLEYKEVNYTNQSNVGEYDILVSGCTAKNYNIQYINGKLIVKRANNILTVVISPITYGDKLTEDVMQIQNKSNADLTFSYKVNAEDEWQGQTIKDLPKDAGTYIIKVASAQTQNYESAEVEVEATIYKRDLTIEVYDTFIEYSNIPNCNPEFNGISLINDTSFAYDETFADLSGELQYKIYDRTVDENECDISQCDVGTYTLKIRGYESNNYNITYVDGQLTIGQSTPTVNVTLANTNLVYGESVTNNIITDISTEDYGEKRYQYKLTTETNSWSSGYPKDIGEYNIRVILTGSTNYAGVTGVCEDTLQITAKEITITPKDYELKYLEDGNYTNVEIESNVELPYGEELSQIVNLNTIEYTSNYEKGNEVGYYDLEISSYDKISSNYIITTSVALNKLHIAKADTQLMVSTTIDRTYGENIFTTSSIMYEHDGIIVNYPENTSRTLKFYYIEGTEIGENSWNEVIFDNLPKNAGNYVVKIAVEESNNYNSIERNVNVKIEKAVVTVGINLNNINLKYNEDLPEDIIYTYTGLVNGDDESVLVDANITYNTDYTKGSNVGEYTIVATGENLDTISNYTIQFKEGKFVVNKATSLIVATVTNGVYGTGLTYDVQNAIDNNLIVYEYALVSEGTYISGKPTQAGRYNIKITYPETENYEEYSKEFFACELQQIELTYTYNNTFTYNGQSLYPTPIFTNLLENDECESVIVDPNNIDAGNYTLSILEVTNKNYKLPNNFISLDYEIKKAELAVPVIESSLLSAVYTGEEITSDIPNGDYYTVTNVTTTNVGTSYIYINLKDSKNYIWATDKSYDGITIYESILHVEFKVSKAGDNEIILFTVANRDFAGKDEDGYIISVSETISFSSKYNGNYAVYYLPYGAEDISENRLYEVINAGKYTAVAVMEATDNYNAARAEYVFEVYKIDPEIAISPTISINYDGETETKIEDIEIEKEGPLNNNGIFEWADTYTLKVSDLGTTISKLVKFIPHDTTNYNEVTCTAQINIIDFSALDWLDGYITIDDLYGRAKDLLQPNVVINQDIDVETYEISILVANKNGTYEYQVVQELPLYTMPNYRVDSEGNKVQDSNGDYIIDNYELTIKVTAETSEGRKYKDYIKTITISIEDYIEEIYMRAFDNVYPAVEKGDDLDLSQTVLMVRYASELVIELYGNNSKITIEGFDTNVVGEQQLTVKYNGEAAEKQNAYAYVYEVNNIKTVGTPVTTTQFVGIDSDNNPIYQEVTDYHIHDMTKVAPKHYSVEFSSIEDFHYANINDYITWDNKDVEVSEYSLKDEQGNILQYIINGKNGTLDFYYMVIAQTENYQYTSVQKLTITYTDLTDMTFNIGNSTYNYDSENNIHNITKVTYENYENLSPSQGRIAAIYPSETTEFNSESNLLSKYLQRQITIDSYADVIVDIQVSGYLYRAKLHVEKYNDYLCTYVYTTDKTYNIDSTNDIIYIECESSVQLSFNMENIGTIYGIIYSDGVVITESGKTLSLDGNDEAIHIFEIHPSNNESYVFQTIEIHLIKNNHIDSVNLVTTLGTYNLEEMRGDTLSLYGEEYISNFVVTMDEGYSYRLYINNELVTGNVQFVNGKNNIAIAVVDNLTSEICYYVYYEIVSELFTGEASYGIPVYDESDPENIVLIDDVYTLIEMNEVTILPNNEYKFSYNLLDDTHTVELYINGEERQLNTYYSLENGLYSIKFVITIPGFIPMERIGYLFLHDENSQYEMSKVIDEGESNDAYSIISQYVGYQLLYETDILTSDITSYSMYTNLDQNRLDNSKLVLKNTSGEITTVEGIEYQILQDKFAYITMRIGEKIYFSLVNISYNNFACDNNVTSHISHITLSGATEEIIFDENGNANLDACYGDSIHIKLSNEKAKVIYNGEKLNTNVLTITNNSDYTMTLIIESTDKSVEKIYNINITIGVQTIFTLSHNNSDDVTIENSIIYENNLYNGSTDNIYTTNMMEYTDVYITENYSDYIILNSEGQPYTEGVDLSKYVKINLLTVERYTTLSYNGISVTSTPLELLLELNSDSNNVLYYDIVIVDNQMFEYNFNVRVYLVESGNIVNDVTIATEWSSTEGNKNKTITLKLISDKLVGYDEKYQNYQINAGKFEGNDTIYYIEGTYDEGTKVVTVDGDFVAFVNYDSEGNLVATTVSTGYGIDNLAKFNYLYYEDTLYTNYIGFYEIPEVDVTINTELTATIELLNIDSYGNTTTTQSITIGNQTNISLTEQGLIAYSVTLKLTVGGNSYIIVLS